MLRVILDSENCYLLLPRCLKQLAQEEELIAELDRKTRAQTSPFALEIVRWSRRQIPVKNRLPVRLGRRTEPSTAAEPLNSLTVMLAGLEIADEE